MRRQPPSTPWTSAPATVVRTVFFVLLGVAGLLLKRHYSGPHPDVVHSYGGNVAASFAVYFIMSNVRLPLHFAVSGLRLPLHPSNGRLLTAAAALLVVELFEVTNGFGVMTNVYDPMDLVANVGGVALALAVDALMPNGMPGVLPPEGR